MQQQHLSELGLQTNCIYNESTAGTDASVKVQRHEARVAMEWEMIDIVKSSKSIYM